MKHSHTPLNIYDVLRNIMNWRGTTFYMEIKPATFKYRMFSEYRDIEIEVKEAKGWEYVWIENNGTDKAASTRKMVGGGGGGV